ncbi:MAG: hypothetical protein OXK72_00725, partial [Gammaproteobacteria bacterium]|nr:hypothetical protein [Gammaproteobacteria bacterium]
MRRWYPFCECLPSLELAEYPVTSVTYGAGSLNLPRLFPALPATREARSCVQRTHAPFGGSSVAARLCKFVARLHPHPVLGSAPADFL